MITATAKISEGKTVFEVDVTLSTGEIFTFSATAVDKQTAIGIVISDLTAMVGAIQSLIIPIP